MHKSRNNRYQCHSELLIAFRTNKIRTDIIISIDTNNEKIRFESFQSQNEWNHQLHNRSILRKRRLRMAGMPLTFDQ